MAALTLNICKYFLTDTFIVTKKNTPKINVSIVYLNHRLFNVNMYLPTTQIKSTLCKIYFTMKERYTQNNASKSVLTVETKNS